MNIPQVSCLTRGFHRHTTPEPSVFHWRDAPSPPTLSCVGSRKGPAIRGNIQKRTTIVR